jgi:cation:H+ antiporter
MLILNLALFLISFYILIKSADYCTSYSSRIAKNFHFSEFIVSFFIVAVISTFPEASISIISAIRGESAFGLGTLFGSNVTDLTLVFGIVALFSLNGIHVKSEILKNDFFYLLLLVFPILLGIDGQYSRIDGIMLVLSGIIFFLTLSFEKHMFRKKMDYLKDKHVMKNLLFMVLCIAFLLAGAQYTVKFGLDFARDLHIPAFIISLTLISIGTCLPELIFSLKSIRTNHDELALGDILGTVITDATVIFGIVAIINPFSFDTSLLYVTGIAMVLAGLLAIAFIRSGKILSKKEGVILIFFYILYLMVEFVANKIF